MKYLIPLLLIALLTASCQPVPTPSAPRPWTYADLRALDLERAEALQPTHDLVAIYTRETAGELQVRLDLLDATSEVDYDLYLAIDSSTGGTRRLPIQGEASLDWNVLVSLPAGGRIRAEKADGEAQTGLKLRVQRDPNLDTIVISLNQAVLGGRRGGHGVQVFLAPAGSENMADSIGPVRTDGFSATPPDKARVLLAFWDSFPASTPAQALRRWDGAHSGPDSARHGLARLLDAVENTRTPVVLLDLKTPLALSALDYSGDLARVERLSGRGLLILPNVLAPGPLSPNHPFTPPAWAVERFAAEARVAAAAYGLPAGPFVYAPDPKTVSGLESKGGRVIFTSAPPPSEASDPLITAREASPEGAALIRQAGTSILGLPTGWSEEEAISASPWQAGAEGPSLEVRRALLEAARIQNGMLILGGSLPHTTWGEPQAALNTLSYLASRPWIEVVSGASLLVEAARGGEPARSNAPGPAALEARSSRQAFVPYTSRGEPFASGLDTNQIHQAVLEGLRSAPPGSIANLAWQAYFSLLAPAVPETPDLPLLRAGYLGQIGHLLEAARWAANPGEYDINSACDRDLDWDGQPECILASESFFAVFEQDGGYISLAFIHRQGRVHQIMAASSQFLVGLGDPSTWKPERGTAGDPDQLRGAFSEIPDGFVSPAWDTYPVEVFENGLTFSTPDGRLRKTFRLEENALRVDYQAAAAVRVQIPLALDPWQRFSPGWGERYRQENTAEAWNWGLENGPQISLKTSASLSSYLFNEAIAEARQPENPNYNYPPGHFLPFPLALVELNGQGEFVVILDY